MPTYTYVKATREDIARLYNPTYFPSAMPFNLDEVLNYRSKIYVDASRGLFSYREVEGFEEYVEILNNYVVGIAIDPVDSVSRLNLAVIYGDWGYLLKKGVRVSLIEARGKGVYPLVDEGGEVSKGDRLFYVVTGKHEVRVIRSPTDGVLLVISELIPSEIQVFRAVLVNRNELIDLKRIG